MGVKGLVSLPERGVLFWEAVLSNPLMLKCAHRVIMRACARGLLESLAKPGALCMNIVSNSCAEGSYLWKASSDNIRKVKLNFRFKNVVDPDLT
jgi:hypothetical protein